MSIRRMSLVVAGWMGLGLALAPEGQAGERLEVMSYNVENLFDAVHDEGKNDWEFTPQATPGKREACIRENRTAFYRDACLKSDWTEKKLAVKLDQIKRIVTQDGHLPELLALVEVEHNPKAKGEEPLIARLAKHLGYGAYQITESPEPRGINVALLYNESEHLRFVAAEEYEVKVVKTRNILEVKFEVFGGAPLYVYVNHWPSQSAPAKMRHAVAKQLAGIIDRRVAKEPRSLVLAVGDFNVIDADYPHALRDVLTSPKGRAKLSDVRSLFLDDRSIAYEKKKAMPRGSYFYAPDMTWNDLDHVFASESLIAGRGGVRLALDSFTIVAPEFAVTDYTYDDAKDFNDGTVVTRVPAAYDFGAAAAGDAGFSDHFPLKVAIEAY